MVDIKFKGVIGKNYFFVYIIFVILFASCNFNEENTFSINDEKNLKNVTGSKNLTISGLDPYQVIDSTLFIKLETSANCLIGKISQICFYKDYIIIMDTEKANAVFLFNRKGRFITRIGSPGKGPKEYQALRSFFIDRDNSLICVFDPLRQCILKYTFENVFAGKLFDFGKMPFVPWQIEALNDSTYITYSTSSDAHDNYAIHIINKEGKALDRFLPHPISFKDIMYTPFKNVFYLTGSKGSIGILAYLSDRAFQYTAGDDSLKSRWVFNLSHPAPVKSDLKDIDKGSKEHPVFLLKEIAGLGKSIGISSLLETNKHLYYTYFNSELRPKSVLYFKKENTLISFNNFENPAFLEPMRDEFIATDGSYFISVLPLNIIEIIKKNFEIFKKNKDTKEFKKYSKEAKFPPSFNENYYNIIRRTNPEDNPVLILTKFKNSLPL